MRRAGRTNSGTMTNDSRVICQDSVIMTPAVSTSPITLETTPDRVEVNARWAPITSLFSRLTRAPVCVRVKKATGMRCTCSNTRVRRS
jgi:hypothetical protein